jgi:hypothetical protein
VRQLKNWTRRYSEGRRKRLEYKVQSDSLEEGDSIDICGGCDEIPKLKLLAVTSREIIPLEHFHPI